MKSRILAVAVLALALACGEPAEPARTPPLGDTSSPADEPRLYEVSATVLEDPKGPAMLCVGGIALSLPPQCGDIPITNWDWGSVEGEESASGTTWGLFHVVGRFDGDRFTVTKVGPPKEPDADPGGDPIDTPCAEPEGGWRVTNPLLTTREDFDRTAATARDAEDFSGLWIDYIEEPASEIESQDASNYILNAAFTGNLLAHEAQLRETWGGALCVSEHARTLRELKAIQNNLHTLEEEFDIQILWSDSSEVHGFVEVGVVVIDAETQAAIDERYGEGVVRAEAALVPVQ